MASRFHIKDGYREQPIPDGVAYFLDDPKGITFQPDVYTLAELLADGLSDHGDAGVTIYDVGCGQAEKLVALKDRRPGYAIVGIDFGANIEHCIAVHGTDDYEWIDSDLESGLPQLPVYTRKRVVIFSDVIEHLANPNVVLRDLASLDAGADRCGRGDTLIVVSTPERDVQYGAGHMGPSPNLCHVREWNAGELGAYLTAAGLSVRWQGLTRSQDRDWVMATQVAVCVPGGRG